MTCSACPFALTDESEACQNLGCLPTPQEVLRLKRDIGKNWSCHEDEARICAGLVEAAKEAGLDYRSGDLASYERWYLTGEA